MTFFLKTPHHYMLLILLIFLYTSPPASFAQQSDFRVVAISDLNGSLGNVKYGNDVHSALENFLGKNPDLIIGVGDFVAGEDIGQNLPLSRFEDMWSAFRQIILSPILDAQTELAPSPGNHDASGYESLSREREIYVSFWNRNKPRLQYIDQNYYPYYYSYMMNGVFFISMDDVTPFRLNHDDQQRDWIKAQLTSDRAQNATARIVYGHIPLYPLLDKSKYSRNGQGKYHEVLNREQWEVNEQGLENIFLQNNVDLAVFGHSHTFFPGKVIHKRNEKFHQLNILSMPCLGSGSRFLSGQIQRSKTGYAVIDIKSDGNITVNGFDPSGDRIRRASLPQRITVPGQYNRYYRDDVDWQ